MKVIDRGTDAYGLYEDQRTTYIFALPMLVLMQRVYCQYDNRHAKVGVSHIPHQYQRIFVARIFPPLKTCAISIGNDIHQRIPIAKIQRMGRAIIKSFKIVMGGFSFLLGDLPGDNLIHAHRVFADKSVSSLSKRVLHKIERHHTRMPEGIPCFFQIPPAPADVRKIITA